MSYASLPIHALSRLRIECPLHNRLKATLRMQAQILNPQKSWNPLVPDCSPYARFDSPRRGSSG